MPEPIFFDASLPILAETVAASLGTVALSAGVVLRDTTGRLAFFSAAPHSEQETLRLDATLRAKLGAYARSDQTFFGRTDSGAEAVLADASALSIRSGDHLIRLIDRRLVGADWMRLPLPAIEAPGLGSVLVTHKTLPEFGVVDVLVENGLQELGDSFYADLVGPCSLAVGGGRIDVMPAFGARSRANPAEVLAKLSRAYTEDIATSGAVATIRDQVSSLIERYASPQQYDAIFVDARAGLNETSASAVTGLGAPSQPASTGMDRATDAGAGLRSRRFWRARSVQGSLGGDGSPFRADCRANRATFRASP